MSGPALSHGTTDAAPTGMHTLNRALVEHRAWMRMAWLAVAVLLAACNEGNGGGGY